MEVKVMMEDGFEINLEGDLADDFLEGLLNGDDFFRCQCNNLLKDESIYDSERHTTVKYKAPFMQERYVRFSNVYSYTVSRSINT